MIWPLFKSFLFFFLVLLPLPFLVPAPDSAKAPFHSSSAVTIKKQVLKNFFKKWSTVYWFIPVEYKELEEVGSHIITAMKAKLKHYLYTSHGYIWKAQEEAILLLLQNMAFPHKRQPYFNPCYFPVDLSPRHFNNCVTGLFPALLPPL